MQRIKCLMIFPKIPKKELIKKLLVENHGEESWTTFQGYLYGPRMCNAKPYAGCFGKSIEVTKVLKFSLLVIVQFIPTGANDIICTRVQKMAETKFAN